MILAFAGTRVKAWGQKPCSLPKHLLWTRNFPGTCSQMGHRSLKVMKESSMSQSAGVLLQ